MALPVEVNPIFEGNRYAIQRSLRFRQSAGAYLSRTPGSASNRQKFVWSGWIKRGTLSTRQALFSAGAVSTTPSGAIYFSTTTDTLAIIGGGGVQYNLVTTQVFRDVSSWYHIVIAFDTTQATDTNRIKVYVNGVIIPTSAFSSTSYPSLNFNTDYNNNVLTAIGSRTDDGTPPVSSFDGYMTEVNFIDGLSFFSDTSGTANPNFNINSFGQYNEFGVWSPRKYGGSYGTNGFYLQFTDIALTSGSNAGLGKDFSGNTNYWNTNGISVTAGATYDAMTDVPPPSTIQNVAAGNYATLNPLDNPSAYFVNATFSAANLNISATSTGQYYVHPTISNNTGKFYHEFTATSLGAGGALTNSIAISAPGNPGAVYCAYDKSGQKYVSGAWTTGWTAWSANDVIGIAVDYDAGSATYYLNGTLQGTLTFGSQGSAPLCVANNAQAGSGGTVSVSFNAGQRPFSYTPPSGFLPLNSNNLPAPTIPNGAKMMAATTYTGAGSTQAITNGGNNTLGTTFQPDFVWIKNRGAAWNNNLYDVVRGTGKALYSDLTDAEATNSIYGYLSAFSASGFSATAGTTSGNLTNQSSSTYVAWQWNAGSGSSTVPSGGSITPTGASINVSAGFSVITYTAPVGTSTDTIPHGLGVAPSFIIVKCRVTSAVYNSWGVYHSSLGATKYLELNATGAAGTASTWWNNTAPTASVFSVGSQFLEDNSTYVAYCWTPIAGYSAMGSYTGNNSSDGPFVYCGFRPRFIIIKDTTSAGVWWLGDSSRAAYNVVAASLFPNSVNAESSAYNQCDFLSNGFKWRADNTNSWPNNVSGNTYVYIAFAENPFKLSLAR